MSSPKLGAAGRPRRVVVGARRTRRAPRRQATAECAPGDHYDRPRSGWERLCVTGCTGQPLIGCSGHRTHAVATLWVLAGRSVHRAHTPGGAAALRPPHSRRSRLPCFGADSAAVVVLSAVGEEGSRLVRDVGASLSGWEGAARAAGLGADEIDLMQTVIVGQP